MTAYNQHTFTSISVGPTGHEHVRAADLPPAAPTAIDCDECVPFLAADGWVFDPDLVPLTERQVTQQEKQDREGNAAVRQAAAALAEVAGRAVRAAQEPVSAPAVALEPAPAPAPAAAPPVADQPKARRGPKTKAEKAAAAAAK